VPQHAAGVVSCDHVDLILEIEQVEAWLPDLIRLANSIENALETTRRQES